MWRPKNWNRKLPGVGRLKIENLADAIIARRAFEAGADAILTSIYEELQRHDLSRFAPASTVEAVRRAILSLLTKEGK